MAAVKFFTAQRVAHLTGSWPSRSRAVGAIPHTLGEGCLYCKWTSC